MHCPMQKNKPNAWTPRHLVSAGDNDYMHPVRALYKDTILSARVRSVLACSGPGAFFGYRFGEKMEVVYAEYVCVGGTICIVSRFIFQLLLSGV